MKHLSLLVIAFLFSSCCSAKQTMIYNALEITIVETESLGEIIPKAINEQIDENQTSNSKITFDHSVWDALLKKYVSEQGNVNYKGLKSERSKLDNYIDNLSNNTPQDSWSKDEKMAYWINAYNAMTVDLILKNYPVKSIKDIDNPWEQRLWKLQDKYYNLDEIEHQILRKMNDPRIHFGIVCASVSCPKLQNEAFVASNLGNQLTEATRGFLTDANENSLSENSVELSKIFKWFAKDFKQDGTLIDFLNRYSDITISDQAKKSYKDYNWHLND